MNILPTKNKKRKARLERVKLCNEYCLIEDFCESILIALYVRKIGIRLKRHTVTIKCSLKILIAISGQFKVIHCLIGCLTDLRTIIP